MKPQERATEMYGWRIPAGRSRLGASLSNKAGEDRKLTSIGPTPLLTAHITSVETGEPYFLSHEIKNTERRWAGRKTHKSQSANRGDYRKVVPECDPLVIDMGTVRVVPSKCERVVPSVIIAANAAGWFGDMDYAVRPSGRGQGG